VIHLQRTRIRYNFSNDRIWEGKLKPVLITANTRASLLVLKYRDTCMRRTTFKIEIMKSKILKNNSDHVYVDE